MARSILTSQERLRIWQEGQAHFNEGRFWHAHEAWEKGWLTLPPLERLHVQALIQTAGALHLRRVGRAEAARSLASRALQKLRERDELGEIAVVFPRLEISGLAGLLEDLNSMNSPEVRLLLSPP